LHQSGRFALRQQRTQECSLGFQLFRCDGLSVDIQGGANVAVTQKFLRQLWVVVVAYMVMGKAYAGKGMYRESLAAAEKYSSLSRGSATSVALLGYVNGRLGERSQALQSVEQLAAASKQNYTSPLAFALVFTGLGDKDRAFGWLERAYQERSNPIAHLKLDPIWDPVRADARFASLVQRIGP
jgi:tetratricopeptide (TPR) repeat protein